MSTLEKLAKSAVMISPRTAEVVYRLVILWRARQAAKQGGPFGQSAEDAWFLGWLRDANIPWAESGFYIDIGANHPVFLSATYLLYKSGWRGLTIEPIPSLSSLHKRLRSRDTRLNVGVGVRNGTQSFWETAPDYFSSFSDKAVAEAEANGWCRILRERQVQVMTPSEILQHVHHGVRVNYLSIDTEGLDSEILASWPWDQCRPDMVACEASAVDASDAQKILATQGYAMVKKFPVTAFWQSREFADGY
jgi:FkbM family methyltransferase